MVTRCGLINNCMEYVATQKNDEKSRQKAIEAWFTVTERLEPSAVDCDGSRVEKRNKLCSVREVRKCGSAIGVGNCTLWAEYPCGKARKPLRSLLGSGSNLIGFDAARQNLGKDRLSKC